MNNSSENRLTLLLDRLRPFDELPDFSQFEINMYKAMFPDPDRALRRHLEQLNVLPLEDFITWFPPKRFDSFKIVGEGAFAKVYQATTTVTNTFDHVTNITFAMKELKASMLPELVLNILLSRFSVERGSPVLKILGLSQHPETKCYLMAMPFAACGTLDHGQYSSHRNWTDILMIALDLAVNLEHLHSLGFCHNDLHAGNVVFHDEQHAEFIDVGLSTSVEEAQISTGVYGRLNYMPPEVCAGGARLRTKASDIYCFGTLLWQMVTGIPPSGIALNAIKTRPDSLREDLIPGAPKQFNEILMACWHPEPDYRPSMEYIIELLQSLEFGDINDITAPSMRPFSPETQSFITQRQATYNPQTKFSDLNSLNFSNLSTTSSLSTSFSLNKSQFYSEEMLLQMIQNIREPAIKENGNPGSHIGITLHGMHIPISLSNKRLWFNYTAHSSPRYLTLGSKIIRMFEPILKNHDGSRESSPATPSALFLDQTVVRHKQACRFCLNPNPESSRAIPLEMSNSN
ncbi:kinase-like domain-containing protein [Endogone sp. FLAS-F59071]|nr:kinase-like domain-containing protein [Endogone sp. FLAS-F59071]|eukprot:RUS19381.1 kinase-like domain-containing protein [Endogone sp. FLAS-F59071]